MNFEYVFMQDAFNRTFKELKLRSNYNYGLQITRLLIAPLRNWNNGQIMIHNPYIPAFNRTFKELKHL